MTMAWPCANEYFAFSRSRSMTRDEAIYPEAETFNPSRWLDPSFPTYREPLTQYPNLNGHSQFGYGYRTCRGLPIVERNLFLSIGGIAWTFDIRKKRRPDGSEVPVHWDDFTPLLMTKPEPFQFDLVARDEMRAGVLKRIWESAQEEGGHERGLTGARIPEPYKLAEKFR